MKKRSIRIGGYDTAAHGWTLTGCKLSDPDPKLNYVEKTGGDGAWDLSTVMTGGITRYKNRTLTATLELSSGTREEREAEINELVNNHDGLERQIVLPDRPDHYLKGRVQIAVNYSDLAHAAVTVTATCEPWLYSTRETVVELTDLRPRWQEKQLINRGRRAVTPRLIASQDGIIRLKYNGQETTISDGTFEWPALLLTPGYHTIEYMGGGSLTISYREAVLR